MAFRQFLSQGGGIIFLDSTRTSVPEGRRNTRRWPLELPQPLRPGPVFDTSGGAGVCARTTLPWLLQMVAESEDLVTDAGIACGLGVFCFVVSYTGIVCGRHVKDISELPHLQALIKCHRVLSGSFIVLLLPLFWSAAADGHPVITPITSFGNGSSWNFGWSRPVANFALAFIGSFLDFHPAARLSCLVGMAQAVVLDTLSSYDLGTQIECVASGNCAVPENYSLWGLRLLNARDLASVVLGTWALLLIAYLTAIIGVCRTTYRFRQLHVGDHNRVWVMQNELAKRMRDRDDSSDL